MLSDGDVNTFNKCVDVPSAVFTSLHEILSFCQVLEEEWQKLENT